MCGLTSYADRLIRPRNCFGVIGVGDIAHLLCGLREGRRRFLIKCSKHRVAQNSDCFLLCFWRQLGQLEDVTPRFASKLERTIRLIYTGTEEDHIVSDVIYGVEKYFRVTGDKDFLVDYGLEMVFLTAREKRYN